MPSPNVLGRVLAVSIATLVASGCATGYGRRGLTGGYSDSRVDDTHWLVSFNGNGYASKERVWNFWLYRCAELTVEKGFAYFDLEPAKDRKQSLLDDRSPPPIRYSNHRPAASGLPVVPAGYTTYYVPGTTTTTWNSSAVVVMYAAIPEGMTLFSAQRVLDLLGPYVKADGSGAPPDRKALVRGASMKLGASQAPERVFPDGVKVAYVDMKKVIQSVPDGKAAVARLKATFAKMQAELNAGKARVDQLRKAYDGEQDAKRKAALEADLTSRNRELKERLARDQAELDAQQKRVAADIGGRAAPIVERVRSAQHLDTVTEEPMGGLWDADITAEVIRVYQETYPASSSI